MLKIKFFLYIIINTFTLNCVFLFSDPCLVALAASSMERPRNLRLDDRNTTPGEPKDALSAVIRVDASRAQIINPLIFGQAAIAYDPCTLSKKEDCVNTGKYSNYGSGQWDPKRRIPRVQLVDLAREINTTLLRFPGGNGVHLYDWKKTIGPVADRPDFQFGLDEFLKLCDAIGAEPIITMSYFTGDDQDLLDMVEYLNHPTEGGNPNGGENWAQVRAANGHPEPYNVRFFEFGNEVWSGKSEEIPNLTPQAYAERYVGFRAKLKTLDADARLGLVLHGFLFRLTSWDETIMAVVKDQLDFAICHSYPPRAWKGYESYAGSTLIRLGLAATRQEKENIERKARELKILAGMSVPLAITEYNAGFVQSSPVPLRHTLGSAMINADILLNYLTMDAPLLCANYHQFSNSYWGLVYRPGWLSSLGKSGEYIKRPNFHVFELFRNYLEEEAVATEVKCGGFRTSQFNGYAATATIETGDAKPQEGYPKLAARISSGDWIVKAVDSVDVLREKGSITLRFNEYEDLNYYHTRFSFPVESGHQYRVLTRVKVHDVLGRSGLGLAVVDARGSKYWSELPKRLKGDVDWAVWRHRFTPPAGTEEVNLQIRRVSGIGPFRGEVSVEDVVVVDIGPDPLYPPTPYLSAVASSNAARTRLTLIVLNKHFSESITTTVAFTGFSPPSSVEAHVLTGPNVLATNEDPTSSAVNVTGRFLDLDPQNNEISISFEPRSLTAVVFERSL